MQAREHIDTINNVKVIYPEGDAPATRYEIHFQGFRGVVTRNAGEANEQVWSRVLGWLYELRLSLTRQRSLLNPHAQAAVYVDVEPDCAERLFRDHARAMIVTRLHAEASNRRDGDGRSRTAALSLLAKIHGIAPHRKRSS